MEVLKQRINQIQFKESGGGGGENKYRQIVFKIIEALERENLLTNDSEIIYINETGERILGSYVLDLLNRCLRGAPARPREKFLDEQAFKELCIKKLNFSPNLFY